MELWERIILTVFILQLILILASIFFIIIYKIFFTIEEKNKERLREKFTQIIIDCLEKKTSFPSDPWEKSFTSLSVLLHALEAFDKRITGGEWEKLKKEASTRYLLPKARKLANSFSLVKRNFSARCFVLDPLHRDRELILKLIDDPVFLVRSQAAVAAVRLEEKKCIYKVIERMSKEHGFAHYFYRDVLIDTPGRVFSWIAEYAASPQDAKLHEACLDLLSTKSMPVIPSYLIEDLTSENKNIRLSAVKIFSQNPHKDSVKYLIKSLNDKDPQVRAEAARGLEFYHDRVVLKKLREALQDNTWSVQFQAAKSLKKMGKKRIEVLKAEELSANARLSQKIAGIVLNYDWL